MMHWEKIFPPTCEKCVDLKPKVSGNAPLACEESIKITLYDHFDDYKRYRETKYNEKKIRKIKEKLINFHPKFTNFELNKQNLDEELENFSTQDMRKFENKLQFDGGIIVNNLSDIRLKERGNKSLTNIPRAPMQCPVKTCKQVIGGREVLGHFLRDHKQSFPFSLDEIFNGQRSVLDVHPENFKRGEVLCLGIVAYGSSNKNECPAAQDICAPNMFLAEYSHLTNYLPLIIFGSKASICDIMQTRKLAYRLSCYRDKMEEVFVIWLCTIETTKRVFCTLTAFDEERTMSFSTIHEVRDLRDPQSPSEFLSNSSNYLLLHQGDVNNLSSDGEAPILLEILIDFYDYEEY